MQKLLSKFFGIEKGEAPRAFLMFAYIFLVIASLLIVKPVRNSFFLTRVGIERLPYAFILVAVVAGFVTQVNIRWAQKLRLNRLILSQLGFAIFCFLLFWILLKTDVESILLVYIFYAWAALFGAITSSQFWILAGYVFNARQAKRIFGFIGAGAITGGIFGGYSTRILAPVIGTDNLLLLCAGAMGLCMIILVIVWKRYARDAYSEKLVQTRKLEKRPTPAGALNIFRQSKHLTYLAGIVGVGVVVANLIDFQYSAVVSENINNPDELTAFFGFWLSNLSLFSLAVQLFLTSGIIKRFGVITSLLFLPAGILAGTVAVLVNPSLLSAIILKVSDGGLKQSINRSGIELLALPIPSTIKNQGKTFIDVFVDSLATGLGGVLLLLCTGPLQWGIQEISFLTLAGIALWLFFIFRIRPEYIDSFREALKKRTIDLSDQTVNLRDASVFDSLLKALEGCNRRQILYALQLLENAKETKFIPVLIRLLQNPFSEIRLRALEHLIHFDAPELTETIRACVNDSNEEIRITALNHLFHRNAFREEAIRPYLEHDDLNISCAAFICLAQASIKEKAFIKQETLRNEFRQLFLNKLNSGQSEQERNILKMTLAKIAGIIHEPVLTNHLRNLLNETDKAVLRETIQSAGQALDPALIPGLISHLNTPGVRKITREALAKYGNLVIPILDQFMKNPKESPAIRYMIPRVLARINSQQSIALLYSHLEQNDIRMRHAVILSLDKLRTRFPLLNFDKKRVWVYIKKEVDRYYKTMSILVTLKTLFPLRTDKENNRDRASRLLISALEERLMRNIDILFILLGLIYNQKDMANAHQAIISHHDALRANALELLDNTLPLPHKSDILWICEHNRKKNAAYDKQKFNALKMETEEQAIKDLLMKDDYWITSCTLYLMSQSGISEPKELIETLTGHHDALVRETAEHTLEQFKIQNEK